MAYAAETSVPIERSQAEIQTTLRRYGASSFALGEEPDRGFIAFVINNRKVRMTVPLPDSVEDKHWYASEASTRRRTPAQARAAMEQERRSRWRALLLVIKAKLEAIESGIETFDVAFMPYIVGPDGQTIGEVLAPRIESIAAGAPVGSLLIGDGR